MRAAEVGDHAEIHLLAGEAGLTVDVEAAAGSQEKLLFVLVEEGVVVGFLSAAILAGEVEISDLAIRASLRGRGRGKRLLDEFLVHVGRSGVRRVLLEVAADNLVALRLYQRAGFTEVGRRARYYSSGQDAVLMDCCLGVTS